MASKAGKSSADDINDYVPSLLNPRSVRKSADNDISSQLTTASRLSLSLKRPQESHIFHLQNKSTPLQELKKWEKPVNRVTSTPQILRDITHFHNNIKKPVALNSKYLHTSLLDSENRPDTPTVNEPLEYNCFYSNNSKSEREIVETEQQTCRINAREENNDVASTNSSKTEIYDTYERTSGDPSKCNSHASSKVTDIEINKNTCTIRNIEYSDINQDLIINCKLMQGAAGSSEMKRKSPPENVECKKKKINQAADNSLILILNKSAVKTYSHIVVRPPICKFVKRKSNNGTEDASLKAGGSKLQQISIASFLRSRKRGDVSGKSCKNNISSHCSQSSDEDCVFVSCTGGEVKATCDVVSTMNKEGGGPGRNKLSISKAASYFAGKEAASAANNPKQTGSLPLTPPARSRVVSRSVPPHKIVAGTTFAVDAFSYGDIPNITTYFLTHFHSDHYAGLRKSFRNTLYCSKVTADLCVSRLGLNPKLLKVIEVDEVHFIDGVEVTAIDANHCPGSIMLLFSLSSGKNVLHCGDFRATYHMESHPAFWNKEIHTIYLDTTYCNPRYDFPSQDESIHMAVCILQQKKKELESRKKKFSSVLIVCGTYTVGKEKFFLSVAASEGAAVWAAPEKDRTLQLTEGRSFCQTPPRQCQLHVLPMREITHQTLKAHLEGMAGAFSEVVAFKPSGWELRKGTPQQHDGVTIHGIPYSEHSSFPEMLRFVKFLQPKLVVPTVEIAGGVKAVQKYFPCPLASKEDFSQKRISDYFSVSKLTHQPAVT